MGAGNSLKVSFILSAGVVPVRNCWFGVLIVRVLFFIYRLDDRTQWTLRKSKPPENFGCRVVFFLSLLLLRRHDALGSVYRSVNSRCVMLGTAIVSMEIYDCFYLRFIWSRNVFIFPLSVCAFAEACFLLVFTERLDNGISFVTCVYTVFERRLCADTSPGIAVSIMCTERLFSVLQYEKRVSAKLCENSQYVKLVSYTNNVISLRFNY